MVAHMRTTEPEDIPFIDLSNFSDFLFFFRNFIRKKTVYLHLVRTVRPTSGLLKWSR